MGKVVGAYNLPAEMWKCLGERGMNYLMRVEDAWIGNVGYEVRSDQE